MSRMLPLSFGFCSKNNTGILKKQVFLRKKSLKRHLFRVFIPISACFEADNRFHFWKKEQEIMEKGKNFLEKESREMKKGKYFLEKGKRKLKKHHSFFLSYHPGI